MPKRNVNLGWLRDKIAAQEAEETDSIFPALNASPSPAPQGQRIQLIAPHYLLDNPYQTRLDYKHIDSLADKIRSLGFRGSLLARPHPDQTGFYELAFGHRRKRAAELAEVLVPVEIVDLSNEQMILLALSENFEREDLTALEEGEIFLQMNDEFHMSQDEIAAFVGEGKKTKINRGYVRNRVRAARLGKQYPQVRAYFEQKPDASLRAVGYLESGIDERGVVFVMRGLSQQDWTADVVEGVVKVLKAGGSEAEALLGSQEEGDLQMAAPSAHSSAAFQSAVAETPVKSRGVKDNGSKPSSQPIQTITRSRILADALKRFRNYDEACGDEAPSKEEYDMLQEMVRRGQARLSLYRASDDIRA